MRLTEKNEFCYVVNIKPEDNSTKEEITLVGESINKIGQLEDIEEELGIDLIVLLKAVKNGVWCKHSYSIDYEPFRIDYWVDYKTNEQGMFICGMEIKDYGKTWALTKEELENDK